ncbi:hypothetical protein CCP3SC1AL1_190037 [Gammaproteobacteria bacterium]
MKTLFQTYVSEFSDIHYCPYCLTIKGDKIVCCQEADFIPFKDLDLDQQKAIIEDELDENQRS